MSDSSGGGSTPPSSPAADDSTADTLTSFLFYTLFVYPVCSWLLAPNRFSRRASIMYAVSFLAILAMLKTAFEISERQPNYFVQLGVDRYSSPADIKKGYKLMSLKLHPDKNPSPNANVEFSDLKHAYDVLLDFSDKRQTYMKFGAEGLLANKSSADDVQLMLEIGVFYVAWGMMAFVLTLGRSGSDSRTWIATGLIAMLLLEVTLLTSESCPLPTWFFPQATEAECVWLLHQLFPAFMNGCRVIGSYTYVDIEKETRALLGLVLRQQKDILTTLRELKARGRDKIRTSDDKDDDEVTAEPSSASSFSSSSLPSLSPSSSLQSVESQFSSDGAFVSAAVSQLHADGSGRSSSSGSTAFYALIFAYVAISYAFNR